MAQLCIRLSCGNGTLEPGEACDDGNNQSGDGCPADCTEPCGDGVLDLGEVCDDGNRVDGDGCSADCRALDGIALVSPPEVAFTAGEGDAPPGRVEVTLRLTYRGLVRLEGALPGWLAVTELPATEYTAAFKLQITDTSRPGRMAASVRFATRHGDGTMVDTYDLPVTYRVEASDLRLEATAATMDFAATSDGPLPPPRTVDLAFNGTEVAVASAPSWITVSAPAPSPSASPATFAIAVNTTAISGDTTISGDVVFATTRGNVQRRATVHVRCRVAASAARVRFVAPYVGVAGRGGTLRVRGGGFRSAGGLVTVGIGEVVLGPVLPDGDTQITVSYPPLPVGRYPVTINGSGLAPAQPELVIVAPLPGVYQAIAAHGPWARLVYDAERQTLYGANKLDGQIERVAYAGGAWSRLPPLPVPRLTDIAMAPDGRSLIVLDRDAIHAMSLTDGLFTPVVLAPFPDDRFCGEFFHQIVAANDGKLFVVSQLGRCSGNSFPYIFDLGDHSLRNLGTSYALDNGNAGGSADGSRIYATGQSSSTMLVFESLSDTVVHSLPGGGASSITVSGDASRVIMQEGGVYSRSLTHLGNVPPFRNQALASQDSTRAILYAFDEGGDRLELYDLSGPVPSGGQYPLAETVMLPDAANGPGASIFTPVAMASSPDDGVVFVSGDSKLLVVPVR